jgi:hypothetical protein
MMLKSAEHHHRPRAPVLVPAYTRLVIAASHDPNVRADD